MVKLSRCLRGQAVKEAKSRQAGHGLRPHMVWCFQRILPSAEAQRQKELRKKMKELRALRVEYCSGRM